MVHGFGGKCSSVFDNLEYLYNFVKFKIEAFAEGQ
jgi:hypothetical protein